MRINAFQLFSQAGNNLRPHKACAVPSVTMFWSISQFTKPLSDNTKLPEDKLNWIGHQLLLLSLLPLAIKGRSIIIRMAFNLLFLIHRTVFDVSTVLVAPMTSNERRPSWKLNESEISMKKNCFLKKLKRRLTDIPQKKLK